MSVTTLAEARRLLAVIQDIETRLDKLEHQKIEAQQTALTINMVIANATKMISIMKRMGLPENMAEATSKLLRFISTVNQLRMSIILLEASMGPVGQVLAGVSIVSSFINFTDVVGSYH